MIEQLVDSGSVEDYTRTWWDVRPHPRFGTVEVRVMDAVTRVDDAIALAAYVQALVHHYAEAPARRCHPVVAEENKWRAARWGLDGQLIDFGKKSEVPMRALALELVSFVDDVVDELGSREHVNYVHTILKDGTSADRQLKVYRETGDLTRVVQHVVHETRPATMRV